MDIRTPTFAGTFFTVFGAEDDELVGRFAYRTTARAVEPSKKARVSGRECGMPPVRLPLV